MNDTLIVAQRTADEVISTAKKNAETIQEQTARECQQVRDLAQLEGKKIIDAANMKRNAILADYSKLVGDRNAFLIKMRTILESELAITHHLIESLPKIEEVDKTPAPEEKPAVEVSIETSKTEETSKPEDAPKPEEIPEKVEEDTMTNIVDVSTKPVTDETKTYAPIKEFVK